jgi:hypothetical protein
MVDVGGDGIGGIEGLGIALGLGVGGGLAIIGLSRLPNISGSRKG